MVILVELGDTLDQPWSPKKTAWKCYYGFYRPTLYIVWSGSTECPKKLLQEAQEDQLLHGLLCKKKFSSYLKEIQSTLHSCCGLFISSNLPEYTFRIFQT